MKHYCQYHLVDKLGRPTSTKSDFFVFTNKPVSDNYLGQAIWLVSGETQDGRIAYQLEYGFIVDAIEPQAEGTTRLSGTRGHMPLRPTKAKLANWLVTMKKRTRNFSNGLSLIPEELVPEMRDALGWYV